MQHSSQSYADDGFIIDHRLVYEKQKVTLYDHRGREIEIKRPIGFRPIKTR